MNNATRKRPVGRPPAAVPATVDFRVRTTPGERDAVDELIARWKSERAAASGGLSAPSDGPTLWFRSVVRKLAADKGILIIEAGETAEVPTPAPRPASSPEPSERKAARPSERTRKR